MDFRNFGEDGPIEPQKHSVRWWAKGVGEADVANGITEALNLLGAQQAARAARYARDARLYGNASALRLTGLPAFRSPPVGAGFALDRGVTYNIVQSVIDTVVARIGKNRPKPFFLTSGGDFWLQRKAKRLNAFCDGLFYENKAYVLGVQALRDACVWGDGLIHIGMRDGRVRWERVFPFEIFVDEVEGIHGEPRQMYRVKDVDRGVLLERFPDKADIIRCAPSSRYETGDDGLIADMVTVREAWHLPSKPGAKDGKHVVSVANGLISDVEVWPHDFFPFARYSWTRSMVGFWSQGLAAQIQGIQIEVNKLLQVIQRSYHLGGTFKLLVENGSKVVKEHLNNEIGAIVSYSGTRPSYVTPPLVQPEIYGHLRDLIQRAYEQAGVSMMSATSTKPLGIESGKAMRTLNDIENDRFHTFGRNYELFYVDLAEKSIQIVAEAGGSYKVHGRRRGRLDEIDWKDIDLPRDAYGIECFPVSSLRTDPAGRLQDIQELMAGGVITPDLGRALMDFPDLEAVESLANAGREYAEMVIDLIIEQGVFTPPEPYDDIAAMKSLAQQAYQQAKTQGLDADRLGMLRTLIEHCLLLEAPPPAPAAPQDAMMPGGMPALPDNAAPPNMPAPMPPMIQ